MTPRGPLFGEAGSSSEGYQVSKATSSSVAFGQQLADGFGSLSEIGFLKNLPRRLSSPSADNLKIKAMGGRASFIFTIAVVGIPA